MPITVLETDVLDGLQSLRRSLSPDEAVLMQALKVREAEIMYSKPVQAILNHQVAFGFVLGALVSLFCVYA